MPILRTVHGPASLWGAGILLALGLTLSPPATAQDLDRARALYDTRCGACHGRSVHQRESRKATDFGALRAEVSRWNENAGGEWRPDEIDLVTVYLNQRYYGFPCPPALCPVAPRAAAKR